jgi:outer membrane protein assembly factor BamB
MRRTLSLLALLALASAARADDWPQFRGPTGQGHAKGPLPVEWAPDKNVTWKQPIPGLGWSSPVVGNGRVYLTTAVRVPDSATKDMSLRALCLDAASGKTLWDVEVLRHPGNKVPAAHAKNSNASPTPVVDGKQLFVHYGHLGTACLDLDGNIQWRNTDLHYAPVHGNGGSPVVVGDLLIFGVDGADKQMLVALARDSGKVKWQTDRKSTAVKRFSFATPLVIEVDGKKQLINQASDMAAAYDPATGAEIWRVKTKGYSVVPRPVFGNGMVYLATGYDSPTLIAVKVNGQGEVTASHLAWTVKKNAPLTPSPLLDGELLYLVSDGGTVSCLDAKTSKVQWSQRLDGGFSASPVLADGKLYFLNEEGTTFVLKAGTKYELLARNELKEKALASFAAVDGVIFLRTAEHLYRIEKR